jgi:hypothetical protein
MALLGRLELDGQHLPSLSPESAPRATVARRRVLALALVAGLVVLAFWTPSGRPLCAYRRFTGRACPGCGLTRAVSRFIRGDLRGSLALHAFGPVVVADIAAYVLAVSLPAESNAFAIRTLDRMLNVQAVALCGHWILRRSSSKR